MTDLKRAFAALEQLEHPIFETSYGVIEEVVNQNQNPDSGGDRRMSPDQWEMLRDALDGIRKVKLATLRLRRSIFPPQPIPVPTALAEKDMLAVVSAEAEGNRVYALLANDRILVSPEMDDANCAHVHAKQVLDLKLSAEFLTSKLNWVESGV
jgi:hypothetical protein